MCSKYLLIVVDEYSGFSFALPGRDMTASTTVDGFCQLFSVTRMNCYKRHFTRTFFPYNRKSTLWVSLTSWLTALDTFSWGATFVYQNTSQQLVKLSPSNATPNMLMCGIQMDARKAYIDNLAVKIQPTSPGDLYVSFVEKNSSLDDHTYFEESNHEEETPAHS